MTKNISGKTWFVCPHCGKKLCTVGRNARAYGVFLPCGKCRRIVEITVQEGRNYGEHSEN